MVDPAFEMNGYKAHNGNHSGMVGQSSAPNLDAVTPRRFAKNDPRYHRSPYAPQKGLDTRRPLLEQVLQAKTTRDQAKLLIKATKNPFFNQQLKKFPWKRLNWQGAKFRKLPGLDRLPLNLIPLNGADLSHNKLRMKSLRNAQMRGVNLTHTSINVQDATGIDLREAKGYRVHLAGDFRGAKMAGHRLIALTIDGNVSNMQDRTFTPQVRDAARAFAKDTAPLPQGRWKRKKPDGPLACLGMALAPHPM